MIRDVVERPAAAIRAGSELKALFCDYGFSIQPRQLWNVPAGGVGASVGV